MLHTGAAFAACAIGLLTTPVSAKVCPTNLIAKFQQDGSDCYGCSAYAWYSFFSPTSSPTFLETKRMCIYDKCKNLLQPLVTNNVTECNWDQFNGFRLREDLVDPVNKQCWMVNCELCNASADPGAWSPCADDGTGKYFQSKVLGIKTPAQFNGAACPAETDPKRLMKRFCPPINCTPLLPEEDIREFGPCTNDGSGTFYKSKILGIKAPAQYGGHPSAFGMCVDNSSGAYYRSKVVGIKVPAQNGGKPCGSEEARTVKVLCPPVNCVVMTPDEDLGDLGPCTKDEATGKYFKSKLLWIKSPAMYGGTCDAKSRTYSVPC